LWRRFEIGDEGDEEDEEDEEIDNFTFPDISPQVQPQLAPLNPSLYLARFSEYERRQIEISSYNDPDVVRRLSDQTRTCHGKRVSRPLQLSMKFLLVLVSANILKQQG